jgi:hypothetical protein
MTEHPLDQITFYAAGTLSNDSRAVLDRHLSACPICRTELAGWDRIAVELKSQINESTPPLPPLSPVVRAALRTRPTAIQALRSAVHLIWAQRVVVFRSGTLPALALIVVLTCLSGLLFPQGEVLFPLLAVIPILGAILTAMLSGAQGDPAHELVTAAPTRPGALLYARLSLALAAIILMASLGSLFLSAIALKPLLGAIAVWLAPLLLLTSLTTVLSLLWSPLPAAAVSLGGWWLIVFLLIRRTPLHLGELSLASPLSSLLDPGPRLVGMQLLLALLLWGIGWFLLARDGFRGGFRENAR